MTRFLLRSRGRVAYGAVTVVMPLAPRPLVFALLALSLGVLLASCHAVPAELIAAQPPETYRIEYSRISPG